MTRRLVSQGHAVNRKRVQRLTTSSVSICWKPRSSTPPVIFNTDQGSQFTSTEFTCCLLDREILISMDGRGRALDNVFIELLWRSVKYEDIYLKNYQSVLPLYQGLEQYIHFYNYTILI